MTAQYNWPSTLLCREYVCFRGEARTVRDGHYTGFITTETWVDPRRVHQERDNIRRVTGVRGKRAISCVSYVKYSLY
jgi:hypothetical protein